MSNLYDAAYELERTIRQSAEYNELKRRFAEVNADPAAKGMFENFRQVQMTIQQKQMMGQDISPDEIQQAQKTVALVQQNPKISGLMEAEQRMSMIIAELNKIVLKPLDEIYGSPQQG
ncbi:YlbF family regulator [Peribacillus kribbensis]|uniref:YlbF family regulator n=1 Tax=Peribacillus kribbensis TaxID=356658 RepID=UPI000408EAA4|nr:YlbF family regulator [Peribacillus kribbensis]